MGVPTLDPPSKRFQRRFHRRFQGRIHRSILVSLHVSALLFSMRSRLEAFLPLPEWHMAAVRADGTIGYARLLQLPYARVDIPDPAAPIDVQPRILWDWNMVPGGVCRGPREGGVTTLAS